MAGQLLGELETDGDADEHRQARLLGKQRADRHEALIRITGPTASLTAALWAASNQPPSCSALPSTRSRLGAARLTSA